MREIKFRAWGKIDKKMYYDVGISEDKVFSELPCYGGWSGMVIDIEDNLVDVMQYTGLKDKNNVEIFEGDIVECDLYGEIAIVRYSEHFMRWQLHFIGDCRNHLKQRLGVYIFDWIYPKIGIVIIGNIYQNPELID